MSHEYESVRRVVYGGAQFVPVCPACARFVTADADMRLPVDGPVPETPNATCRTHGRVAMPCEGYVGDA